MLIAARDQKVKRFVFASSSAVYGDEATLPKVENRIGKPLSPYAATKAVNELYAEVFARCYGMEVIGLRYFNVFGPRQDPSGPYAAVIPRWIEAMLTNQPVLINGDGQTSRDFCYVSNVVQANLLAATTTRPEAIGQMYNIAAGARTTLNELFELIRIGLLAANPELAHVKPEYRPERPGDIRHSLADISKAQRLLSYEPECGVKEGLERTIKAERSRGSVGSVGSVERGA